MNSIFTVKKNYNKRNSCLIEKGINDIKNRKKFAFQYNSKPHRSKIYFLILISIFFIVVPIGLEPQLQTNYVFGESDFHSQNVDDLHYDKGDTAYTASPSSSESSTKQDLIDPFDSGDNSNNKKFSENLVIPDIFGTQDHNSSTITVSGSAKSSDSQSELQTESESVSDIRSQYNLSSGYLDNNNADVQLDPSSSNINNNTNTKINEEVAVSGDLSNTNNNQSSSTSSESGSQTNNQPRYKSYRDYIDNNIKNDTMIQSDDKPVIETDNKPVSEVNSKDSQGNASGDSLSQIINEKINALEISTSGIPNSNLNSNVDKLENKVTNPENQSKWESNSATSFQSQADNQSSDSNSTVTSQPLYKSYRDFVEHNKANEVTDNDDKVSSKSVVDLDSSNAPSLHATG